MSTVHAARQVGRTNGRFREEQFGPRTTGLGAKQSMDLRALIVADGSTSAASAPWRKPRMQTSGEASASLTGARAPADVK
ncbi:hypothetical protein MPC1_1620010 [Methylocella tundrae]|nr:hypothetical protein MPC1_1620010 [Methylocella tundrae]